MKKEHTKLSIVDSLFTCLEKKEFEEITANEIYIGAGISKRTFYNHFKDKYEIIPWFWNYQLGPYLDEYLPAFYVRQLQLINTYFYQIQKLFAYRGQNSFYEFYVQFDIKKYRKHISKEILEKYPPDIVEFLLNFLAQAVFASKLWFGNSKADFEIVLKTFTEDPDLVLRMCTLVAFSDYLSYEVYPEGMHI